MKRACGALANILPIPDDMKDDFTVACKVVAGGPLGAFFTPSRIGPEPDRSSKTEKEAIKNPVREKAPQEENMSRERNRSETFSNRSGPGNSGGMSREPTRVEKRDESFERFVERRSGK